MCILQDTCTSCRIHQDTYPIGTPPKRIGNPPFPHAAGRIGGVRRPAAHAAAGTASVRGSLCGTVGNAHAGHAPGGVALSPGLDNSTELDRILDSYSTG